MSDVIIEVDGGVGCLTLNRPRTINSLTTEMCEQMLSALQGWTTHSSVATVELRGAGERGFCSGADVRQLRELVLADPAQARRFFDIEYELNALLAEYPKPVRSYMSGITMGGGMGLTVHTSHRIADETTLIAMPETTIGLFPDVGALYELSRAPGQTGAYLALTGAAIDGASAKFAGLVDEAVGDPAESALARDQWWIDECFASNDAITILDRLLAHPEERAREAGALLATKSPLSVWVSLVGFRRACGMWSVREVLAQDIVLAYNFVADSDFAEGVRAQLVDKDKTPAWRHASLAEVSLCLVESMFEPGGVPQKS